jgi:hypothetical protein
MASKYQGDLNACEAPDQIAAELRHAADKAREARAELQSAWQDKSAGASWLVVARELERCAQRLDKMGV